MSSSLQDALESLESLEEDVDFHTLIPEGLLYSYIPVKEKEVEVFQSTTEE